MLKKNFKRCLLVLTAPLLLNAASGLQSVKACTEILLNKSDGVVISGRTLDYNCEMGSKICFRAAGTKVSDPGLQYTRLSSPPLTWTAKYNAVVVDAFNEPCYVDGMNSEGLSVGTLWHSDTQPASQIAPGKQGLSNVALVEYILENAKNLEEARKLISDLSIFISVYKGQTMALHWIITERSGKSVVMELKAGRPRFFDEPTEVGVLTNEPAYDIQLANLNKCRNKLSTDKEFVLPGDYKSKSRFVKSAYLVSQLPEFKSADDAITSATQILHNVESPRGAQGPNGSYTQFMVVRDQTNLLYRVMGVKHTAPKVLDLKTCDFKQLQGKKIAVESSGSGDIAALARTLAAEKTDSSTR